MIGDDSLVHSEKPTMPMSVERMEAIAAKVGEQAGNMHLRDVVLTILL